MLDAAPTAEQMTALVGTSRYEIWNQLCALIEEKYDMDRLWNTAGAERRCAPYMRGSTASDL